MSQSKSTAIAIKPYIPWIVWGTASVFFFYQFIVRVCMAVIAQPFQADLGITACEFGAIVSFFYWGYTAMQIPVGILFDQFGVRRLLLVASLLLAGGCYLFSTTIDPVLLRVGRLFMGIGAAFGFLSCVKTASLWFRPDRLSMVIGLSVFIGPAGAVFGGAPLSLIMQAYGWKALVMGLSLIGILIAVFAWTFVRDSKQNIFTQNDSADSKNTYNIATSLKLVLKNPKTYIFGIYGSAMYALLSGYAELWGPSYIEKAYHVDTTTAAGIASTIWMGIAFGGPVWSWVAKYFKSYKTSTLIGTATTFALGTTSIYYTGFSVDLLWGIFFLVGLFASCQFLAFSSVCEINPREISATASAFHNMMCMASGIAIQKGMGYLIDQSALANGSAGYALADYRSAMILLPISMGIALLATFLMKETYPKSEAKTA